MEEPPALSPVSELPPQARAEGRLRRHEPAAVVFAVQQVIHAGQQPQTAMLPFTQQIAPGQVGAEIAGKAKRAEGKWEQHAVQREVVVRDGVSLQVQIEPMPWSNAGAKRELVVGESQDRKSV